MPLDDALTSRDTINLKLREILDDATDKWGTRVVRVELQRIDPPADVMHAMHEQMKAERTRRATVTTALGDREAAITRAEGDKQAAILSAEGEKQAVILSAEGDREAAIARANGEAEAIRQVYSAIHEGDPSPDLIAIKYLETLGIVANGQATKVFLPTEATALLGALGGMRELLLTPPPGGGSEGGGAAAAAAVPAGTSGTGRTRSSRTPKT